MPGTKILNVQKSDSVEEVLDAFTKAEADEVIFIFPRGTVFARDAVHFETIKGEAQRSGKLVNIMTSDPVIAHLASQQGLGLLQNPALTAELAVARKKTPFPRKPVENVAIAPSGRKIRDIMTNDADQTLEVESGKEKDVKVPIVKQEAPPPEPLPVPEIVKTPTPVIPPPASVPPLFSPASNDIERLWAEEEQRQNQAKTELAPSEKKKWNRHMFFIPIIAAVIILWGIVYATTGSAKIVVNPKTQDIDLKVKITASATAASTSFDFNRIPGQQFSVQKSASGTYPSTSEKEVAQKATGNVTIRSTSTASQRLVATTRLESKDGFLFRIPATITVPANGSIMSMVYADRPGKEYNIGPTTFTVPGFKDTPHYEEFSATSSTAMHGGMIGTAKVVAEEEYVKATTELTAKAKQDVLQALKDQTGALKILEDSQITVGAPVSNAKAGEAADTLEMTVKATATVVAFREADVIDLIEHYISKNGELELRQKDLDISYTVLNADASAKMLVFEVHVMGKAAAKLDTGKILNDVRGMNAAAIRAYFQKMKEVDSARIVLAPFWITSVPKDPKKIHLDIQF